MDCVVPTYFPSTVISAESGFDLTVTDAAGSAVAGVVSVAVAVLAMGANFDASRGVSAATNALISVPLGIVMSLPCMNRNNGAAGKNNMPVATIAPVIAPV